jgi:GT2 family glycosyltransferase
VVDDCSTDETEQVVRSFSDYRIKYIRQDRNRRVSAARNTGIRCAQGEYVAFLDDDDEWLPEKLQKDLEVFRNSDPRVGLVYSGMMTLDEHGRVLRLRMETTSGWVYDRLLIGNFIGSTSRITAKKQLLDSLGGFDETFLNAEDYDLCLRVARLSKIACVPGCWVKHHMGGDQNTGSLRRVCEGREHILQKYRGEMKPRTLAIRLFAVAILLFNYEPRRARAMAWESLRLRPRQGWLVAALAASILGTGCYRLFLGKMIRARGDVQLARARV